MSCTWWAGAKPDGEPYRAQVVAAAAGLPVQLHVNASGAELRDLYSRAALFWHATGLGEDDEAHPERLEHFGITTVEAMSAGAVPVVIAKAGQLELFEDGLAGYHWRTIDELVDRSRELVADPVRRTFMADRAVEAATCFAPEAFAARLEALVARLGALPPLHGRGRRRDHRQRLDALPGEEHIGGNDAQLGGLVRLGHHRQVVGADAGQHRRHVELTGHLALGPGGGTRGGQVGPGAGDQRGAR